MSYATLMVQADEGVESDARVSLACDLAIAFDARLIGVAGSAPEPPLVDPYAGGAMLGEMLALYRDLAEGDVKRAETGFRELVAARAEQCEWRGKVGFPADLIVQEARAADLIILGRRNAKAPYHAADPADVLMAVGRPVLIAPPAAARAPIGWPALVAWTDSREAQRAVAAALPLLRRAESAHVLEVCAAEDVEGARARTADVAAYLGRHGVVAEAEARIGEPKAAAEIILAVAADKRVGLVVAGGYGHARVREWVMGGVTKALLADCPVCLLLSH